MTQVHHLITGLNIGGAEIMLARFLRHEAARAGNDRIDWSVLSLMSPGAIAPMISAAGVPIDTLGMSQALPGPGAIARLIGKARGSRADLLHGWMYHGAVAATVFAKVGAGQPVVWGIHHSVDDIAKEKRTTQWIIRLMAALSGSTAAITYCSRISARQHEALGFKADRSVIIPNGIDCTEFRPDPEARARLVQTFGLAPGRLIVGNVARGHPMKDHGSFVRTIDHLLKAGLDVQGLILGADHEAGAARRVANELGINDRILTPGPRQDVASLLPGFDAFMLSSAWGEAFPLSVGEAMAAGVPVAATRVGDCDWLVGDESLLSPPSEPAAQAAVLERILRLNQADRTALGLAGRQRIIDNFSLSAYGERHTELYRSILADRRRPS